MTLRDIWIADLAKLATNPPKFTQAIESIFHRQQLIMDDPEHPGEDKELEIKASGGPIHHYDVGDDRDRNDYWSNIQDKVEKLHESAIIHKRVEQEYEVWVNGRKYDTVKTRADAEQIMLTAQVDSILDAAIQKESRPRQAVMMPTSPVSTASPTSSAPFTSAAPSRSGGRTGGGFNYGCLVAAVALVVLGLLALSQAGGLWATGVPLPTQASSGGQTPPPNIVQPTSPASTVAPTTVPVRPTATTVRRVGCYPLQFSSLDAGNEMAYASDSCVCSSASQPNFQAWVLKNVWTGSLTWTATLHNSSGKPFNLTPTGGTLSPGETVEVYLDGPYIGPEPGNTVEVGVDYSPSSAGGAGLFPHPCQV